MKKLKFGIIKIPASAKFRQSGSYTSTEWNVLTKSARIKMEPPTYGNPLLKEVVTKNYSHKS